jgi:hypothetical protein
MTKDELHEATRSLLIHTRIMVTEATDTMKRLSGQLAQAQTALELLTQLLEPGAGETREEEEEP